MRYVKYSATGNTYIVVNPSDLRDKLSKKLIKQLCSEAETDGLLLGPLKSKNSDFSVRIFNPDGNEAEKSGNGLRIFSRYLYDQGLVKNKEFTIKTLGGQTLSRVFDGGKQVRIEMGRVSFWSNEIPVMGKKREVLNEKLKVRDRTFTFCAATIGNPHCVIILPEISEKLAKHYGSLIERDSLFPNRVNVQFVKILDRNNIEMFIWERGAGYTLASGSSSCAAVAVAYRLKLCNNKVKVHMPGGKLDIEIKPNFSMIMTGPVKRMKMNLAGSF